MNTKTIVAVASILIVLGAGYAVARTSNDSWWGGMMGGDRYGNGMMGGYGGATGYGSGMMGHYAGMMRDFGNGIWNSMMGGFGGMMGGLQGMMGYGSGMMGTGGIMGSGAGYGRGMMGGNDAGGYCGAGAAGGYGANATPITIEKARDAAEQYLASTGDSDLKLSEVMEFDNNFYAGVKEKSTGTHAFELLVNKYNGNVFPEMGPNMMWNTKYGHMNWNNNSAQTTVTEEQALKNAQAYLDKELPGAKTGDADAFYGYYTIEVLKDSKIYGMLSINSYTGAPWYHNWHGAFVKNLEVE